MAAAKEIQGTLPFPVDPQQMELLRLAKQDLAIIASKGTDRFDECSHLVDAGYLRKTYCPTCLGVYMFELTRDGREAVE